SHPVHIIIGYVSCSSPPSSNHPLLLLTTPLPPRSPLFPLHDALPISHSPLVLPGSRPLRIHMSWNDLLSHARHQVVPGHVDPQGDRKSTRLNSSHGSISYAVFCLKKKK